MSRKPQDHCNQQRIRQAVVCGIGLLALLLAGVAFPTDTRALGRDLGDAPSSYGTLRADTGAEHKITLSLHLGALIDSEGNGQPSLGADGDDLTGVDDEDGILLPSVLTRRTQINFDVILTTDGTLDAFLNAWIDFNADGDWDDFGEQIFNDEPLVGGSNALSFGVPPIAALGDTYARFRLDSGGGLTPYGLADDGEVEDYLVKIVPLPEPTTFSLMAFGLIVTAAFRRPGK